MGRILALLGCRPPNGQSFANRSRVVSFDRPYEVNGAPQFLAVELPLIHLVERFGLDLSYTTNVDVHRKPDVGPGAQSARLPRP